MRTLARSLVCLGSKQLFLDMKKFLFLAIAIAALISLAAWKPSGEVGGFPPFGDSLTATVDNMKSEGYMILDTIDGVVILSKDDIGCKLYLSGGKQCFKEFYSVNTESWGCLREIWDSVKKTLDARYELLSLSENFESGYASDLCSVHKQKCNYMAIFRYGDYKIVESIENACLVSITYIKL